MDFSGSVFQDTSLTPNMDSSLLDKAGIYYQRKEACRVRAGLQIKEKAQL